MTDMPESIFAQKAFQPGVPLARSHWYETQIIPTLTEYVRKDIYDAEVEKGMEAALCAITADGQAQDALGRALMAEAEVERLRGLVEIGDRMADCFNRSYIVPGLVGQWAKVRAALQTESLAADDNHL